MKEERLVLNPRLFLKIVTVNSDYFPKPSNRLFFVRENQGVQYGKHGMKAQRGSTVIPLLFL